MATSPTDLFAGNTSGLFNQAGNFFRRTIGGQDYFDYCVKNTTSTTAECHFAAAIAGSFWLIAEVIPILALAVIMYQIERGRQQEQQEMTPAVTPGLD